MKCNKKKHSPHKSSNSGFAIQIFSQGLAKALWESTKLKVSVLAGLKQIEKNCCNLKKKIIYY
jgi:hypothetical protein